MLTNKHVIAALLVTPILAVLGYFAVDTIVSEKPHQAVQGASYELIAKPNCRYTSGRCDFKNGNFEVGLTLQQGNGEMILTLDSKFPLHGARVSIRDKDRPTGSQQGDDDIPARLTPVSDDLLRWQATFARDYTGNELMHVAISAQGSYYYGETGTIFANHETSFGKRFD